MSSDLTRYKEEQRQLWSRAAETWRRWHEPLSQMSRDATEAIVNATELGEGMKVLDLAGGTGEPALTVAGLVGGSGSVVASDFVPEMVATLEENVRQRGLTNVTCQQVDAEAIPFPDASFDRVSAIVSFHHTDDPGRALDEIRRVLAPGGRVVLHEMYPGRHAGLLHRVLGRWFHGSAPHFVEPGHLARSLEDHGFRNVVVRDGTNGYTVAGSR